MNVKRIRKHIPQVILIALCLMRAFDHLFNMLAYFALYADKTAGFSVDLSCIVWGVAGAVAAVGLFLPVFRKISAWVIFVLASLDILAGLYFVAIEDGLMLFFVFVAWILSASMLLLGAYSLYTVKGLKPFDCKALFVKEPDAPKAPSDGAP